MQKASEIQSGVVFPNIYTENYEAMENVFKILRENYFQTRIPYPAKSSLQGEIKIKFLVMQGFNNLPPMWRMHSTKKGSKTRKMRTFYPETRDLSKGKGEGNSQDAVEGKQA